MNKLISVHIPKTAGASFGKALEDHFQTNMEVLDDVPLLTSEETRTKEALTESLSLAEKGDIEKACIHGHFLPVKFLLLSLKIPLNFITWMRNPVERAVSHYNFWYKVYDSEKSYPHHKRVIEEEWSLERFCFGPEYRNFYSQFLWGFPLENFDFIGIVEHYEEDLSFFARNFLNTELTSYQLNSNTSNKQLDRNFVERFEAFHERDVYLYKKALEMRELRIKRNST